jgi:glycosyltransferase involved in cell wall biosynthesis
MQVSVIIPTFNRAAVIGRAIKSVLAQTHSVHEIIIVDDASSDNTVQASLNCYPACRIIQFRRNQGAQAARSAGIQAATGEWIAFLDSDDWWLPQKLEWQLEKAAEGFSVIHGPGIIRRNGQDQFFAIPPLEGQIFAELLRYPAPHYPCLLVRRECFEKAGYPDPAICAFQEWDMSLMLARHYTFGYVDKPLFVYEVQEDSISKDDYRGLRGYEQIVVKWWKEIILIVGIDAGLKHYQNLARQALHLTGIAGFLYFSSLAAKLTGNSRLPMIGGIFCGLMQDVLWKIIVYIGKRIPYVHECYKKFNAVR